MADQRAETQQQLDAAQKDVAELKKLLEAIQKEKSGVQGELKKTESEMGQLEKQVKGLQQELNKSNDELKRLDEEKKKLLEFHVFNVLDERERHSEKTLAELYDPDKMPSGLREAHHNLDIAIEQCYRLKPFASDEERLEYLFTLYEQMTSKGYTPMETTDMNNKGYQNVRK